MKDEISTLRLSDTAGTSNEVIVGGVVSALVTVIVTFALRLLETLPAASLAQAYSVFAPALPKV
jgi:hypothetical protein